MNALVVVQVVFFHNKIVSVISCPLYTTVFAERQFMPAVLFSTDTPKFNFKRNVAETF